MTAVWQRELYAYFDWLKTHSELGESWAVGVSGGADSLASILLLDDWAKKNNIEITLDECYYGCVKKYRLYSGVYDVVIPKYSKPGNRIYLEGLGWNGGDLELEIVIKEKNNYYLDSKLNLHYILDIDIWDAILGFECEIKVFDENIKCNIKPYTKTGDMFLLIGKGYPNGRYKTNLIIEVKIKDLLKLNEEQLNLVKKIKEISE